MITLTSTGKEKLQSLIKSKVNLCDFLEGIELEDLNLSNGILDGINLYRRTIKNCNLTNVKIRRAIICRAKIINCNCTFTNFEGSDISYADFYTSCIYGANMIDTRGIKVDLSQVSNFCNLKITFFTKKWKGARIPKKMIDLFYETCEVVET